MTWGVTYHGGPLDGRMEARETLPPDRLRHPIAPRCSVAMYDPNDTEPIAAAFEWCEYQRMTPPVGADVVHYYYIDPDSFEGAVARLRSSLDETMLDIFAGITVEDVQAAVERPHPSIVEALRSAVGLVADTSTFGFTPDHIDQAKFDRRPDYCWRCNAVNATTDVGLCDCCHDDLTGDK